MPRYAQAPTFGRTSGSTATGRNRQTRVVYRLLGTKVNVPSGQTHEGDESRGAADLKGHGLNRALFEVYEAPALAAEGRLVHAIRPT